MHIHFATYLYRNSIDPPRAKLLSATCVSIYGRMYRIGHQNKGAIVNERWEKQNDRGSESEREMRIQQSTTQLFCFYFSAWIINGIGESTSCLLWWPAGTRAPSFVAATCSNGWLHYYGAYYTQNTIHNSLRFGLIYVDFCSINTNKWDCIRFTDTHIFDSSWRTTSTIHMFPSIVFVSDTLTLLSQYIQMLDACFSIWWSSQFANRS